MALCDLVEDFEIHFLKLCWIKKCRVTTLSFGSYLIWAAEDEYRVFIDPRIELYPIEIWRDYITISNALPGWKEKLLDYGIQVIMANPKTQSSLTESLATAPGWSLVFEDQAAVIYVKTPE